MRKWLLIILIGGFILSGCNRVKQEVVTKYIVFERFGEIELDTNFLKNRGFNERNIINYDKRGKVLDDSWYTYEYEEGFVLQSKRVYKNDSIYAYDEDGQLKYSYGLSNSVKIKSIKQDNFVYIINEQDTLFKFQLIKNTKDLIIRKVIDNNSEDYLEFIERIYY